VLGKLRRVLRRFRGFSSRAERVSVAGNENASITQSIQSIGLNKTEPHAVTTGPAEQRTLVTEQVESVSSPAHQVGVPLARDLPKGEEAGSLNAIISDGAETTIPERAEQLTELGRSIPQAEVPLVPALPERGDPDDADARVLIPPEGQAQRAGEGVATSAPAEKPRQSSAKCEPGSLPIAVRLAHSLPKTKEVDGDDRVLTVIEDGLFAVADGASTSLYSGLWAEIFIASLLGNWIHFRNAAEHEMSVDHFDELLSGPRRDWLSRVNIINPKPKYYEVNKLAQGAHSTFVALHIQPDLNQWEALAFGDSCLFQLRLNQIVAAFPVTALSNFPPVPDLVCSRSQYNHTKGLRMQFAHGTYQTSDVFLLASDALSRLIFSRAEAHHDLRQLVQLADRENFNEFVLECRQRGELENDDASLVTIEVLGDGVRR